MIGACRLSNTLEQKGKECRGVEMQRWARFLLWGGLAITLLSLGACGVGCLAGVAAVGEGIESEGGEEAASFAGRSAAVSFLAFIIGIIMLIIGAVLKAFAPKPTE